MSNKIAVKRNIRKFAKQTLMSIPTFHRLFSERDQLFIDRDQLIGERDQLAIERNQLLSERNQLHVQLDEFRNTITTLQNNFNARAASFDAIYAAGNLDLIYTKHEKECYLVNCRDAMISKSLFVAGEFEFHRFIKVMNLLKSHGYIKDKIDLLIDVGANIGNICIPAITRGYATESIAIEPDPLNFHILKTNIVLNTKEDFIKAYEMAAGAIDNEILKLEISEDNCGDHRISVTHSPGIYETGERKKIEIKSNTIDSIVKSNPSQTMLLHVVVQGYEGLALKGAKKLLQSKPPILIEFWPYAIARAKSLEALIESTKHYEGFYFLGHPSTTPSTYPLYPMTDIKKFYEEIGENGITNYLLIV